MEARLLQEGEEVHMKTRMLAGALAAAALSWPGPAPADDRGTFEQQRDCTNDAMTFCSQYIFVRDRNARIAACLWENRTRISLACRSHLHAPRRS